MAKRIQEFQDRLDMLEDELAGLVADVEKKHRRIAAEAQALRLPLTVLCLGTVAELAQQAVHKLESSAAERDQFQRIQQQLQEPCESTRMAAYACLRRMHKDCPLCKRQEECAEGRALRIMRDLVVLTVSVGKGELNLEKLKTAIGDALRQGCGRDDLDQVDQSELTFAFAKALSLGRSRDGFDAKVRSANMFGPEISEEEVQQLFLVYNACARASPHYVSKNKVSRKHKKRSASPQQELAVAASAASASAASTAMPVAMSESSHSQDTLSVWQLNACHGWGERQRPRELFDPSFDVSQMYPRVQETHACSEFGFFDPRDYFCSGQPFLEAARERRAQETMPEQ